MESMQPCGKAFNMQTSLERRGGCNRCSHEHHSIAGHSGAAGESPGPSAEFKPRASSTPGRAMLAGSSPARQARCSRPAGHCVGPAAPVQQRGRGGTARVASLAAARKRQPSPTRRRRRAWRAAAACTRPAGWGPRPGGEAGGGARPGTARQGYLLHGPLDGGVWGLGLLEQLQDLLKPLLVRFPLILHLGLLQIKPDTGRDEQMLVPRIGPPRVRAPARCPRPAAQPQPRPQPRLGPETGRAAPKLRANVRRVCAVRHGRLELQELTRLSHREFAIWPQDPLTGAPWVLVPRCTLRPNQLLQPGCLQEGSSKASPCEALVKI